MEKKDSIFTEDKLEDKRPKFYPGLIDSRPVEDTYGDRWEINASSAVIGLDILPTKDIGEEHLLKLYPSYAEAARAFDNYGAIVLPSVNMFDGKSKQFDDGLLLLLSLLALRN